MLQAVSSKVVAAADVFTTADRAVPTQAAQVQNLILQGYDAIVINAASPNALNGAVRQACNAGIVVVSFDSIVTEPCAWRIAVDFKTMGKDEITYLKDKIPAGEAATIASELRDAAKIVSERIGAGAAS